MDEVARKIRADLRRVESALMEIASALPGPSRRVALHLLRAGGKRFRPALTVASGRALGGEPRLGLYRAAAAVELVHTASLIHDDLVDGSEVRRGRKSAPAAFGNDVALIAADLLFTKAFEVAGEAAGPEAAALLSRAVMGMCEGELEELEGRGRFDLDLSGYLERVRKKTGSLMAACCMIGAMVAGADDEAAETLGRFGEAVGAAFQAVDDLRDMFGDPKVLGKPTGGDFRAGKASLPLVLLLSDGDLGARERALRLLRGPRDERALREIAEVARKAGVPERGLEVVARLIEGARGLLAALPDSEGKRMLEFLADSVVRRGEALLKTSRG